MSDLNEDVALRELASWMLKQHKEEPLRLIQGIVQDITGGTLTLILGGGVVLVEDVHALDSYSPTIGDTVWGLKNGPDVLVLGKTS